MVGDDVRLRDAHWLTGFLGGSGVMGLLGWLLRGLKGIGLLRRAFSGVLGSLGRGLLRGFRGIGLLWGWGGGS